MDSMRQLNCFVVTAYIAVNISILQEGENASTQLIQSKLIGKKISALNSELKME